MGGAQSTASRSFRRGTPCRQRQLATVPHRTPCTSMTAGALGEELLVLLVIESLGGLPESRPAQLSIKPRARTPQRAIIEFRWVGEF